MKNSVGDVLSGARTGTSEDPDPLSPLLKRARQIGSDAAPATPALAIGELLALVDDGVTPLISLVGQPHGRAIAASSIIELDGRNIGSRVLVGFIENDANAPVVLGVLSGQETWNGTEPPAQVQIDAGGKRLLVSARDELVLRCGKASVTLTKAGKVLVDGTYVSVRSTGVHRIKGGSIELN